MPFLSEIDLSAERVRGYVAGLRPYRSGSPRLEIERAHGKWLGHNYGHGGSGITMAWGSCLELLEQLKAHLQQGEAVAVLGAGVMGLCTATLLQEQGYPTVLYADSLPQDTVSCLAGGLWAPTHVGHADPQQHERILRRSWHHYQALDSERFGVYEVPLFESDDRAHPLDEMPEGLTLPPESLEALPFPGHRPPGRVSTTLLIETRRFLAKLLQDFRDRGGRQVQRRFSSLSEIAELPESSVVNCCGLGARELVPDPKLSPIRGQLVLLDPAPKPFVLDHAKGYIISRRDVLVLGGTFEEGEEQASPNPATCDRILHDAREFFGLGSQTVTNP